MGDSTIKNTSQPKHYSNSDNGSVGKQTRAFYRRKSKHSDNQKCDVDLASMVKVDGIYHKVIESDIYTTTETYIENSCNPKLSPFRCFHCNALDARCRCSQCKQVYFCSRNCQIESWGRHRVQCQENALTQLNIRYMDTISDNEINNDVSSSSSDMTVLTQHFDKEVSVTVEITEEKKEHKDKSSFLNLDENIKTDISKYEEAIISNEATLSKRAKKTKRKHASQKSPVASQLIEETSDEKTTRIEWGHVNVRTFERLPGGGSTVPQDGSWALGMGKVLNEKTIGSVDEFEYSRAMELNKRVHSLSDKDRKLANGETRQFDFRSGAKNPLFKPLSEMERKKILSESREALCSQSSRNSQRNVQNIINETLVETINQANEFEEIRQSRQNAGCSCGKNMKAVLKYNTKKLKDFLQARNIDSHGDRPTLLKIVKDIATKAFSCSNSSSCECNINGIGCHESVCDCVGCQNHHSVYRYNPDKVTSYRRTVLKNLQNDMTKTDHI